MLGLLLVASDASFQILLSCLVNQDPASVAQRGSFTCPRSNSQNRQSWDVNQVCLTHNSRDDATPVDDGVIGLVLGNLDSRGSSHLLSTGDEVMSSAAALCFRLDSPMDAVVLFSFLYFH